MILTDIKKAVNYYKLIREENRKGEYLEKTIVPGIIGT